MTMKRTALISIALFLASCAIKDKPAAPQVSTVKVANKIQESADIVRSADGDFASSQDTLSELTNVIEELEKYQEALKKQQ